VLPPFIVAFALVAPPAAAQSLGTFYWRMEPYCNTLVLAVIQDAGGFRLQGREDLCDAIYGPQPVEGSVVVSGNSATLALTTNYSGGSRLEGSRVLATINISTLTGFWHDNEGRSGALTRVLATGSPGPRRGDVGSTFLHIVAAGNRPVGSASNVSCFSHPLADGNSGATLTLTPNRGRQSSIRPVVASTVSVYFDDDGTGLPGDLSNNVWCISRDDSQTMPIGAGFTVRVQR
jgi:hypothetical protein